VLHAQWDVVIVDGPSGAAPEEPKQMGSASDGLNSTREKKVGDEGAVGEDCERWR
jgi:hypothetical protein